MENYTFYLVLQRVNYNKTHYQPGDIFPELTGQDLSALIADKVIIAVDAHIKDLEAESKKRIEEIEATIADEEKKVKALKAKVEARKQVELKKLENSLALTNNAQESQHQAIAQGIAKHLIPEIKKS